MTSGARVEEILRQLGFDDIDLFESLRDEGLFPDDEVSAAEAEQLRVALVLMREMGVNAAGVEVILHLRSRLLTLQTRTERALQLLLRDRR
ncbi:MAG: hypothetical protein OEM49_09880 [Myxococcales bacterium]|nr:hypothetical protein [Myxococcales bacterium]MDH5305975.1 hypothetical protein [Myxococcales bacterium]MDH5567735.1 hypothetical protein [Myxococcales bacterium]